MARRLEAMGTEMYRGLTVLQGSHTVWTGRIAFDEKALMEPLRRRMPTVYFVNSMSDLFHPGVTEDMRDRIFAVMALTPKHTYQVLTKRADQMQKYMSGAWGNRAAGILVDWFADGTITTAQFMAKENRLSAPLPNVWLGVSTENQAAADERIPLLLQTPAAKRFISAEPLLGSVNLRRIDWVEEMKRDYAAKVAQTSGDLKEMFTEMLQSTTECRWEEGRAWRDALTGAWFDGWDGDDRPEPAHRKIDWVICGGESGPGARPMHPDWARGLRDQCVAAGVPFFFKQFGEWGPQHPEINVLSPEDAGTLKPWTVACSTDRKEVGSISYIASPPVIAERGIHQFTRMKRVGKKAAGHLLDGMEWHQFPEVRA
jgi:protein gp37